MTQYVREDGTHTHRCRCGYHWRHREPVGVTLEVWEKVHTCRRCGCLVTKREPVYADAMKHRRKRSRPRRHKAREENPKKSTLYWILGGVGVLGTGGLIYWLVTRNKTQALPPAGGGATGALPMANTTPSVSLPPPTSNQQSKPPQPTSAVQTPQGYNTFLQDASNFVNTLKGVGVAVSTIINLYNNLVNVVAQQFQVSLPSLVPANLGLSSWPPGISSAF